MRNFKAQGFEKGNLFGGVVQVVIPANDMGNVHFPIIYYDGEVIGWGTIGSK